MDVLKGSCLCGSIRYSCTSSPVFVAACHCAACQKATGSAFAVVAGLNKADFTVSGGKMSTYEHVGDSSTTSRRYFCPKCGSGVYSENPLRPGMVTIRAGTLEDAAGLKPSVNVYWRDHQKWVEEIAAMPRHDTSMKR
ncbi:MAG TPA: GFA family protein [Chitinivibrionales bacterium]|nr:GFA family protein [Chitinivibrionales bacterium]